MTRLARLILVTTAVTASPALAGSYSAIPAATPESNRIIARDIVWTCGPDACRGSTAESRPLVLCQDLAKRTGRLTRFVADGRAFAPAQLAKCNASAKATLEGLAAAR